jgi:hypothetical protein
MLLVMHRSTAQDLTRTSPLGQSSDAMTERGSRVQTDARTQSDGPVGVRTGLDGRVDQRAGRSGGARDRGATYLDLHAARGPERSRLRSAGGLGRRWKLAALYLRAAGTLESSAQLAERNAQRARDNGLQSATQIEQDRARQGALRGRGLAARYAQPDLNRHPSARAVAPSDDEGAALSVRLVPPGSEGHDTGQVVAEPRT